jgi:phage repressor protein C with HTH and peptisase S24 domain
MRKFFGLPADGDRAARGGGGTSYRLEPLSFQERGDNDETGEGEDDAWVMPASMFETRTKAPPEKIKIMAVNEDAMAPDFQPGEQVLVDLSDTKPSPAGVFVVSDGMGHVIRQCEYVPNSAPPEVRLSARNDKYSAYTVTLDKAAILGRVIAKLEWL